MLLADLAPSLFQADRTSFAITYAPTLGHGMISCRYAHKEKATAKHLQYHIESKVDGKARASLAEKVILRRLMDLSSGPWIA